MLTHSTNLPDQKPPDPITISVVIPTFNRAPRLREALEGFARAEHPSGLDITVIVVDNNSNDGTRELVEELRPQFLKKKLEYIFEPRQGRSFALNTGIAAADCDLLSTFDDDEIITPNWFVEVEKVFREKWAELDFLGGKILPNWEIEPPSWVEPLKVGALCVRDFGDEE